MKIEEVSALVGDLPNMTPEQARRISQFFLEHGVRNVLELGFCHGVSTCYMAATLAEKGAGSIVTIDLESARHHQPNIEELLTAVGQRDRVTVYYEPTSYTWRLMRFLEQTPVPQFDFCYIDGAHTWFVDALAFFLVDRLIRPGGWILFDDLGWTYDTSPTLKDTEWVARMPAEERSTPQIKKIYELLVKPHPSYDEFRVESHWAFARKRSVGNGGQPLGREIITEKLVEVEKVHVGVGQFLMRCVNKLRGQ
jgi:predicted O-methyltransferase YrrM